MDSAATRVEENETKKKKKRNGPRKRRRKKKAAQAPIANDLETVGDAEISNAGISSRRNEADSPKTVEKSADGESVNAMKDIERMSDLTIEARNRDMHLGKKEKKKKHSGPRKRRRKKKKAPEVSNSQHARLNQILAAAMNRIYVPGIGIVDSRSRQPYSVPHIGNLNSVPFGLGGISGGVASGGLLPRWLDLDRKTTTTVAAADTPAGDPMSAASRQGLEWLKRRASAAGLGITPIETSDAKDGTARTRMRRVASWGKHTTQLDPIYRGKGDTRDNWRTSLTDDASNEEFVGHGSEHRHLEQMFSPAWGAQTEAWQRERLKQWVIWAEEQERATRVRETYDHNDTVNISMLSIDPMDYEVVCPYTSNGCAATVMRKDLSRHLSVCQFRPRDIVPKSPVDVDESYEVMCPYAFLGCTYSCSRDKIGAHINECPYRYEKIPGGSGTRNGAEAGVPRRGSDASTASHSSKGPYNMHERYSMMLLQLSLEIVNFAEDCKRSECRLKGIVETAVRLIHEMARELEDKDEQCGEDRQRTSRRKRNIRARAVLFGSRAMHLALPGSDVDVAVQLLEIEESGEEEAAKVKERGGGEKEEEDGEVDEIEEIDSVGSDIEARKSSDLDKTSRRRSSVVSQVDDKTLCLHWLRRMADSLGRSDDTPWLEWMKVIDTTAVPVIKLGVMPHGLLERARGNIYRQLSITSEERKTIASLQLKMQMCMERILSCGGLDLEATEKVHRISAELASLQREMFRRAKEKSTKDEIKPSPVDKSAIKFSLIPSSPKLSNVVQAVAVASGATEPITIDITLTTHGGVEAVELVRELVQHYPELRPLVLVIKQLLRLNGLNDPYRGGLSSYGLVIMVVSLLQRRAETNDGDEGDDCSTASASRSDVSDVDDEVSSPTSRSPKPATWTESGDGEKDGHVEEEAKSEDANEGEKVASRDPSLSQFGSLNNFTAEVSTSIAPPSPSIVAPPTFVRKSSIVSASSSASKNSTTIDPLRIGEVLLDFLQVYGTEFDPAKNTVSLDLSALNGFERFVEIAKASRARRNKGDVRSPSDVNEEDGDSPLGKTSSAAMESNSRTPPRPSPYVLKVHDPLKPHNNVTRSCFAISQIQHVFTQVLIQMLLMGKNTTHVGGKSVLEDAGFLSRGATRSSAPPRG